jgi:hypothetical protein
MLMLCTARPALAAAEPTAATPGLAMDYGPFLSSSVQKPSAENATTQPVIAAKGITIRVGNNASVCYDTDLLRMAAAWSGGFLDLSTTHLASLKGSTPARVQGEIQFGTTELPGWSTSGKFNDPRAAACGPLPVQWAHYKGLYRHGDKVVLSYSVGSADVLEMPGSYVADGQLAFTRTLRISESKVPLSLLVCEATETDSHAIPVQRREGPAMLSIEGADGASIHVGTLGAPSGTTLRTTDNRRLQLDLPPLGAPFTIKLVIAALAPGSHEAFVKLLKAAPPSEDLPALCHGGPALWKQSLETAGRRAADSRAYVVDTIELPESNPWHCWMRPSAIDFFSDGRCAVATMNGDVWIVSGLDADLRHVTWKRFAAGLYEPLGLRIVNDQIYVLGRDQITRLHDLNGDGEANFYENFSNGAVTLPAYHAFHLDLQTDSQGNFYYTVDGNGVSVMAPMHACILKTSKDGSKTEVYATGIRVAAGAGVGPGDELVCSDNQGNWTPVCRINRIKPGAFYGFNGDPHYVTPADTANERKSYEPPICWIPYEKDNSTGGQTFVTGGKWGPLEGRMLSTSYGKCKLFEVLEETVDGIVQGASVELPLQFQSGLLRGRFNPADGQLYVCGLKGWQTSGVKDGCLQRVRFTGKPVRLPTELHVKKDGIAISFACPLDPSSASDEQNYGVSQWNYRWASKYGSDKYKPSRPGQVGTDDVDLKSAKLLPDGKTVFLEIPNLRPVMQMSIQVHVNAADGTPVECEIDCTINHVPGSSLPPVLTAP